MNARASPALLGALALVQQVAGTEVLELGGRARWSGGAEDGTHSDSRAAGGAGTDAHTREEGADRLSLADIISMYVESGSQTSKMLTATQRGRLARSFRAAAVGTLRALRARLCSHAPDALVETAPGLPIPRHVLRAVVVQAIERGQRVSDLQESMSVCRTAWAALLRPPSAAPGRAWLAAAAEECFRSCTGLGRALVAALQTWSASGAAHACTVPALSLLSKLRLTGLPTQTLAPDGSPLFRLAHAIVAEIVAGGTTDNIMGAAGLLTTEDFSDSAASCASSGHSSPELAFSGAASAFRLPTALASASFLQAAVTFVQEALNAGDSLDAMATCTSRLLSLGVDLLLKTAGSLEQGGEASAPGASRPESACSFSFHDSQPYTLAHSQSGITKRCIAHAQSIADAVLAELQALCHEHCAFVIEEIMGAIEDVSHGADPTMPRAIYLLDVLDAARAASARMLAGDVFGGERDR